MDDSSIGGRRSLSKFRDILRRPREDSDAGYDTPDINYVYADADEYSKELAELYSYTEEYEFDYNKECFDQIKGPDFDTWTSLEDCARRSFILRVFNMIDVTDRDRRMTAVKSILYLLQGVFAECETVAEQARWSRHNSFLLYQCGVLQIFVELLNMEVDNPSASNAAIRKPAVSIADSTDIRIIINVLYHLLETLRHDEENDPDDWKKSRENFLTEITQPIVGEDPLCVILFTMVTKFCAGNTPQFPIKKVLLLLWKVILLTLSGLHNFYDLMNTARITNGLPLLTEDSAEVCRNMRASSPPASAVDLLDQQNTPSRRAKIGFRKQQGVEKSLEDPFDTTIDDEYMEGNMKTGSDDDLPPTPPRPASPRPQALKLPWIPKVRQKDLEVFLEHTRTKFIGFPVKNDFTSLFGLPQPINEGVHVLKQHLYLSLSEVQVKKEEQITKNPLSKKEFNIEETPAEVLYRFLLPNLPQYMIALLKILLAAAPTSRAKSDTINILADVLPEEMPTTVLKSMRLGMDVNRHKEIIVKAISAVLLLVLKHFKLNHIYQFEYMSQHLVFANCIPLVLKFFNQNINAYVQAKNTIPTIDYPTCVVGPQPELTADTLESGDNEPFCWRNIFSCINLLRVLNKLTKWKHSRTMMLVVFKSAPILKRALRVKHAMMQLYILKLLKMQTKYLGRQWRKSNMKTMSAIYQKVRHRLTDDWAFGNDIDARPWDFQAEECALRSCVDHFNARRYGNEEVTDPEFEPIDNSFLSVLGENIELSQEFKTNYETWLNQEVFAADTDWNRVIS